MAGMHVTMTTKVDQKPDTMAREVIERRMRSECVSQHKERVNKPWGYLYPRADGRPLIASES